MTKILAFDLGSSSGRAIKGEYENNRLVCEEIYRFENRSVYHKGKLCWNFPQLMCEIKKGITLAGQVDSIGFDTWGADFGMLDENGELMELPVHYRDSRTEGMISMVLEQISAKELFQLTGNQTYATNTLYQLLACKIKDPEIWKRTKRILHIPDLCTYQLTGKAVCERTIASTTQMLDPMTRTWSQKVLNTFQIPSNLFAPLVDSGTIVGEYQGAKVIAVAGHDTQSAGAAFTSDSKYAVFLNIGTWSLMGIDREKPVLSDEGYQLGISNEQNAYGNIQCIMNMAGMWLLQEVRREWKEKGMFYTFDELEGLAEKIRPNRYLIDPNSDDFIVPGNMQEKIQQFCKNSGQKVPETPGEITRCIYDSLVWNYRWNLERMEKAIGYKIEEIHILGGGAKSRMLCQMTSDICRRSVVAGPVEATALGNILLQLKALGEVTELELGR